MQDLSIRKYGTKRIFKLGLEEKDKREASQILQRFVVQGKEFRLTVEVIKRFCGPSRRGRNLCVL